MRTLTGHSNGVTAVAFSPDGQLLAFASEDCTAKLWEVASGREVRTLTGHSACVTAVAFSPDGQLLASASDDGTAKLWEVASGREVRTLSGQITKIGDWVNVDYWVTAVAFSPDGQLLASAT